MMGNLEYYSFLNLAAAKVSALRTPKEESFSGVTCIN